MYTIDASWESCTLSYFAEAERVPRIYGYLEAETGTTTWAAERCTVDM